jgi:hypothetical protein
MEDGGERGVWPLTTLHRTANWMHGGAKGKDRGHFGPRSFCTSVAGATEKATRLPRLLRVLNPPDCLFGDPPSLIVGRCHILGRLDDARNWLGRWHVLRRGSTLLEFDLGDLIEDNSLID